MPSRSRRSTLSTLLLAGSIALAACGGGDDGAGTAGPTTTDPVGSGRDDAFVAQVASYELVAGQDQRFLAALAGNGTGTVVSFGSVDLEFFYLGTREKQVDPPESRATAKATFFPVAGQEIPADADGPREARPSEGLGVYAATGVRFDEPGFWGVRVKAKIGGKEVSANAPFEVRAEPQVPFPGQPAPRTVHPLPGAEGIDPKAIDSRAQKNAPIPDEVLHRTTIADALAAGKPTVVVVSTPVYCVSQFCGPITDSVAELATTYEDRVAFVHLEVWKDFEKRIVNPFAAEWISPKNGVGDTQEPWVFLIGSDGVVKQRFDNVVGDEALASAVKELAGG
jgi:hypothetical protein